MVSLRILVSLGDGGFGRVEQRLIKYDGYLGTIVGKVGLGLVNLELC